MEYFCNPQFKQHLLEIAGKIEIDILKSLSSSSPENDLAVFEIFMDTLDKTKQHLFFIRNNLDNYIVCNPPEHETVYYVGSFKTSPSVDFSLENIGIPLPVKHNINSIDDLINTVNKSDCFKVQGIVAYVKNGDGYKLCKIVNDRYISFTKVRNNEPSIRHRYLALRSDPKNSNLIDGLCYLYPHYVAKFDHIEYMMSIIANTIYKNYVDRYVKHLHTNVPKDEYKIMKECYDWSMEDIRRRVSRRIVTSILNKQNTQFINMIVKRYALANKQKYIA